MDGMPKMHKLITLGGQHQGIMNGPQCSGPSFNQTPSTACRMVQRMLGLGAYLPWIRSHVVQAQYFKVTLADLAHVCVCLMCWGLPGAQQTELRKFSQSKYTSTHQWQAEQTQSLSLHGVQEVIVTNTNTISAVQSACAGLGCWI